MRLAIVLLLTCLTTNCRERSSQRERAVTSASATAASVALAPLPPAGPIGPTSAGLGGRRLSRDLTPYKLREDVSRNWLLHDLDVIERTRSALPPAARRDDIV